MAIDKNTIMKEAQKYVAKGQFDKAIAEWRKLLKESPHDANIFNTIGDLCLKKNSKAEAVDAYRRAADILAQDGFASKAIALYKKVLNIDSSQVEVHLALGDMNAEKGLTGNALENYKHVADHYKKENKTAKALGIYQKMADLNPTNVAFRLKLADMYAKEKMIAEASKAYLDAADVHMSKEAFNDARQLFEKVLALDPNNKTVYHRAGIVYFREGKFGEACKALKPAFEIDPSNRELADSYLDALAKAGKESDAEQVITKILAVDADRPDLQDRLCQLLLARQDYQKALVVVSVQSDALADAGHHEVAEGILRKFVAACPRFAPGFQKLADLYRSMGRGEDAARALVQAATILADAGDAEGARASANRALEFIPGMPEASDLLGSLARRVQTAAAAPPPQSPPVESVQAPPPPRPAPTEWKPPVETPAPPAYEAEPFLEPVAPPAEAGGEPPAIQEALTEADVLVKYGLATKAIEQLEVLSRSYPESTQIHLKLHDLYGDQGQMHKAAGHMLALADLYAKHGSPDLAEQALHSARGIDPTNRDVIARFGAPPEAAAVPQAAAAPSVEEGFPLHEPAATDEIVFEGLDAGIPSITEEFTAEERVDHAAQPPFAEEPAPLEMAGEMSAAEEAPFTGSEAETSQDQFVEERPLEEAAPFTEVQPDRFAAAVPEQPPAEEADLSEIWAEAEFYYQQGLFDEAKKHYAKIVSLNPAEKRAIERLTEISREQEDSEEFTKLAEAVEGLETSFAGHAAVEELPMSESDEDAVRSLMQEISQIKTPERTPPPPIVEEPAAAPPRLKTPKTEPPLKPVAPREAQTPPLRPAAPPPEPVRFAERPAASAAAPPRKTDEEEFFDLGAELAQESKAAATMRKDSAGDDFFDLASELRDELSNAAEPARPAASAEEQSLDEIFEEFKKGVEQQSIKEDVDTHYNLGVAYKEMGLLDDAISEFTMTPEDEPKFIQSRYMLGLCYMEKGEFKNAIGEIQNALDYSESLGEEAQGGIEMHYDLGLAYQGAGNTAAALREFQVVAGMDPAYRDTRSKLKELKQGDFVSLDQLKTDIEKEISAKFLEEGERIEREEKHRKSEKIRN